MSVIIPLPRIPAPSGDFRLIAVPGLVFRPVFPFLYLNIWDLKVFPTSDQEDHMHYVNPDAYFMIICVTRIPVTH